MSKFKYYITKKGRVSYPILFKPKRNVLNGKDEYSIDLIFDKNSCDLSDVKNTIEEAIRERWTDKRPENLRMPIKDGDAKKNSPKEYQGAFYITFKTTQKPGKVDNQNQEIIDQEEVYGGCFARVQYHPYAYDAAGNKGVSLTLDNVQKIADGEPFSGKPEAEEAFGIYA